MSKIGIQMFMDEEVNNMLSTVSQPEVLQNAETST